MWLLVAASVIFWLASIQNTFKKFVRLFLGNYMTASGWERYILTCKRSEYFQDVLKTYLVHYVTISGCEHYILTCKRSEYFQQVSNTFLGH